MSRPPAELDRLRAGTQARILLGRSGGGLPTAAAQRFLMDHARAREAVWTEVDFARLQRSVEAMGVTALAVASAAQDRSEYLRRPDRGRKLGDESRQALQQAAGQFDLAAIVADGLSATAIEINAVPLLAALLPRLKAEGLSLAPIVLASQARVALADDIGAALSARVSLVLIGERPGLSASDSLGAYLTYGPTPGLPDSRRNCISNIREGGLPPHQAADAIMRLMRRMLNQRTSGVTLAHDTADRQLAAPQVDRPAQ